MGPDHIPFSKETPRDPAAHFGEVRRARYGRKRAEPGQDMGKITLSLCLGLGSRVAVPGELCFDPLTQGCKVKRKAGTMKYPPQPNK